MFRCNFAALSAHFDSISDANANLWNGHISNTVDASCLFRTNFAALFSSFALAVFSAIPAAADPMTELGRALFFDKNLSINGTQSCASCHDPAAGFAADGVAFIPGALGGHGNRIAPSAAYAFMSPPLHHVMEDGAPLFVGGLFHDGRATGDATGQPVSDQAGGPILNPGEMALPNQACAVQRACESSGLAAMEPETCQAMQKLSPCGASASSETLDATVAFLTMTRALSAYEASAEVSPFSSRFDEYVAGNTSLTAEELSGLDLFSGKGKCAACHALGSTGEPALFTDFTYDNLGLPANPGAPLDVGLAATLASDPIYAPYADLMQGKFKVPTLRNVAEGKQRHYMHNGYFATLAGVVRFYNTSDLWPDCKGWMPEAEAMAAHCWPAAEIAATANHDELGNLGLTPKEEAQIVAFMEALTDKTASQ